MSYWYLAFSNKGVVGACVVAGDTLTEAIRRAWELNINPGGSVIAFPVPLNQIDALPHDRFMPVKELRRYGLFQSESSGAPLGTQPCE